MTTLTWMDIIRELEPNYTSDEILQELKKIGLKEEQRLTKEFKKVNE